jgi:hypothetical protein
VVGRQSPVDHLGTSTIAMHGPRNRQASNRAPQLRAALSFGAALSALSLTAMYASPACALDPAAPEPIAAAAQASAAASADTDQTQASTGSDQPPTGADSPEAPPPDSTEQGHTQLPDSFDHRPVQALLHESSLVGLRDTTFNVQLRSFYLDRDNFNTSQSQAWTLGGSAGFKTGYFADFLSVGATGYTSQRLYGPLDKDGTQLLQTGQQSYTVQGELYAQLKLTDEILATVGRRGFDTPFINTRDSLMTPQTFEVYAVQGTAGSTDGSTALRFGAGYVDQIKLRNSENFQSMATAAGAPGGVDRGVYVAGANYKVGQLSIGAINYYSADIIDIGYTEIKYGIPLGERVSLRLSAQYTDQHSTGDDLLNGKSFSTHQSGFKADLTLGASLLTVARTVTAIGTVDAAGSGTSIISPWGGYPGYTAVQIENFFRGGENATMLRAAYNLPKVTGLSVYALWVDGTTPHIAQQYAQREYDLNVQWVVPSPALNGLKLLARYGHVSQGGPSDQHQDELRLVLYYQLR